MSGDRPRPVVPVESDTASSTPAGPSPVPHRRASAWTESFPGRRRKFHPKRVSPTGRSHPTPPENPSPLPSKLGVIFELIHELGANLLRVYHVPPRWFLDLAQEHGLKLLVDVPWNKHLCFLDSPALAADARIAVRDRGRTLLGASLGIRPVRGQ